MERPERPPRSWVGAWEAELWTWQLKQKWGLQRDTTLSWLSAPAFPQWVTLAKFLATLSILHFLIYETDTNKWPREVCCEDQSCSSLAKYCCTESGHSREAVSVPLLFFISVTLLNGTFSVLPDLSVKCPTNAFYTPRTFPGNVRAYHIRQLLSLCFL